MPVNRVAEDLLGTMGAVCWTIQLIPQIWLTYRTRSTKGLSEWLMLTWGSAGAFFGTYAVVQDLNVPLILQPQLFTILCFASWAQCQFYGRNRPRIVVIALYITALGLFAGFQVGMIFAIRPAYRAGNVAPVEFFGVASSVLIAVALIPQYYEIYKHKEVIGVSIMFMTIDLLGGVFSDLSLAFKDKFDVVAGVAYSLVVVMDGIVILCALILNPLARRRRRRQDACSDGGVETVMVPAVPVPVDRGSTECLNHMKSESGSKQGPDVRNGREALL